MFRIEIDGDVFRLLGRLDAHEAERNPDIFACIQSSAVLDFSDLKYISSAGLGLLFAAQKRLLEKGMALKLVNLNPDIGYLFKVAGFDSLFEIEGEL